MAIQITPLLDFDPDGPIPSPVPTTEELVDQVRLDVPSTAYSRYQAERVLVHLGMTETQARQRLRFCLGERAR